jgi:hypothetical protein
MRSPKYSGHTQNGGSGVSKNGKAWLDRDELMHMRWMEEVRCSRIKQKARGQKLKPINLDD